MHNDTGDRWAGTPLEGHVERVEEGSPGRPGVVRIRPREEPELYATAPWTKHRFPLERGAPRISWKVLTATSGPYRCQGLPELPAGHVEEIPRGARHVRVALRPWKGRRWRDHRLCRSCGVAARLATEARPPDDGTHVRTSSGRWTRAPGNDSPPNDSEPS